MSIIAERIYKGETAYDIGISDMQFTSRKEAVDRFLLQWSGSDFVADYLDWLPTQPEGGAEDNLNVELPGMPKITTRAKNFSKAMFKIVVNGLPFETREGAKKKLAICETNECGYFDGSICRHQNCGCFSKIKTFFETESCPIDKW